MTMLMTMDRLNTLLDAYGASPSRWPAEEREAAEAMIAVSDEARAAFAEAARLDALLDQAAPPPPADRLGWRLRGIGPKAEPAAVVAPRRGWTGHLVRAAAVVLAVAGGVAIGVALPGNNRPVQVATGNDAPPSIADTPLASLSGTYQEAEAEIQDGDTSIVLAGYNGDTLSLPLQ